ncbi:MAG: SDR family oxidoreductase [Bacteroidales bacterium]|nr:SDR family oxidoreductase [Bacteroidales bacterium]MDD5892308.1 SDR family NAD(P)-dependent oxidoreductase [Bacteroidales bacterium]MDY5357058.1 SDR family NAD(P)-dependent oxidoreductase [Candidatus Cryptobacteroides sp.]
MNGLLKGKVAVVTGGTRGIGYAIVKKFLEEGAITVLCGSREETAKSALAKIKAEMPDAQVDAIWPHLSDRVQMTEALTAIKNKYGRLDILANNAGISQNTPLFDYNDDDFDKIMDLNVKAVYSCTRAAAELMKETGGSIINTSSIVSYNGQGAGCGYPASKFAVNGLTKSLSRELGRYGIRVNAVAPGVTKTDMLAVLPDEMIQPIIKNIPLGRMAEPEDIANAFLFLASDLSSYISGAILPVAGAVVI